MHFKQIEITGFKSFADRTLVKLDAGMTAIVGPNGCGKSNILDAMRWTLGEQSAKALRGTHMSDVIFNGSEHRAATGLAEVTMTFDNADSALPLDFAEIQISRRAYRSGESEYLINKAPCRLRDIQELFMDTGIGTNAYSMIGQGKIGMVLSSKPDDRRFLFEEAAGIIKYKSRKRVALRKLDQAEQNLVRLGDIVSEVQRQMRSLKRQVNAAIRYRELTDQLKELEIRAAWLRHQELSGKVSELREKFKTSQDGFEKASTETDQFEARFEELSLAKLEVDRILHARREGVHEIDTEMERIERQIALLRQQIDFSGEQQQQAQKDHTAYTKRADELAEEQRTALERTEGIRAELTTAREELDQRQGDFNTSATTVAEADAALEAVRARSVETMNERARNRTEIETLTVNVDNVEAQLQTLYARQADESARHGELVGKLEALTKTETETQEAFDAAETERKALAEQGEALAAELKSVNDNWRDQREKKSSTEARLNSLRELRDSYEGFAAGVRAVMLAKKKKEAFGEGIIGPVGDLVSTEKAYEHAVEAALGGNINNVIVEYADAAKEAIDFLKQHKAGRVTFLPLDTIRPGFKDEIDSVLGKPGVVGPVLDVVRFDSHLHSAMAYLFHNTVIVETIDDAIRIARGGNRFPRMVTLDGEVVTSSGAVTGGRTKHDSRGLLGRSAEIDELDAKVNTLSAEIAKLQKQGETVTQSIADVRAKFTTANEAEAEHRKALNGLSVEIARLTTEANRLNESAGTLKAERDALIEKRDALEGQRREASEKATTMESEDETLQREIAEAQEAASRARQAQSEIGSGLSDLRVRIASLSQNLEEAERDGQRLLRERDAALAEAKRRIDTIESLKTSTVALENEIKDHIERSKALSEDKEEAHEKVVEADNKRKGLLDESEQVEKRLKELRDKTRELQSTVHKLEIELRHDEDQMSFFEERILSEYHVALANLTAQDVGNDEYPDAEREKMVKDIRQKLERMGSVNLMAIEEFEALTERHDFLVGQETDLRNAKEALLNVVQRIDSTIKQMFLDTFNTVADNFRQNFRRLFNGGQARIYLLDESDPLESGIEIEARPPGKKPQTISLLSGGEQAMTAIGLLFSIFQAKPSPFCVLDEVDAPLDDANIGRFLEMIDEFTSQTQFIVITHNKQTMARADALYGVTQQERGVSTLVSVRLENAPTEAEPAA